SSHAGLLKKRLYYRACVCAVLFVERWTVAPRSGEHFPLLQHPLRDCPRGAVPMHVGHTMQSRSPRFPHGVDTRRFAAPKQAREPEMLCPTRWLISLPHSEAETDLLPVAVRPTS